MLLLTVMSIILFGFFKMSPTTQGPVGTAFAVSMAVLGAIGILHWMHESSSRKSKGLLSSPLIKGQLYGFMTLPTVAKLILVLVVLTLPIVVDSIK